MTLGDGVDFSGAKLEALEDEADLAGGADCGRKLWVPDRAGAGVLDVGLGVLLTGGRVAGRVDPEPEGAELEVFDDDGEDSPGVLDREELPPLATARAAAASAGLDAPRTGAAALFDGGGVATVGPDDEPEADGTG